MDRRFLTVVFADGRSNSVTLDDNGLARKDFPEPVLVIAVEVSDHLAAPMVQGFTERLTPPGESAS